MSWLAVPCLLEPDLPTTTLSMEESLMSLPHLTSDVFFIMWPWKNLREETEEASSEKKKDILLWIFCLQYTSHGRHKRHRTQLPWGQNKMAELQGPESMGSGLILHLSVAVGWYYNIGLLVPTLTFFNRNTLICIIPQIQCWAWYTECCKFTMLSNYRVSRNNIHSISSME